MNRRLAPHLARRAVPVALACAVALAIPAPAPASAAAMPASAGRDVSWPQCGTALPAAASFGVIGVNGGASFTRNPCLAAQLGWAKTLARPPAFYANTGDPGPAYTARWPLGQARPRWCSPQEPNSLACSFDYGWNAGVDAFSAAMDGAQRLHHYDRATAHRRVANVDWWLDVEILNSWQTLEDAYGPNRAARERDVAALAGQIDALWGQGVGRVGIYSTAYQWDAITGGHRITRDWFAANPAWLAGFSGSEDAVEGCTYRSFTGGPVLMTQYLGADGLDTDAWCG